MSEITRSGKWNPGGGRWLELLPAVFVASYVRASLSAAPVITLIPGASWSKIYCTPGTLQYRLGAKHSDNGPVYTLEVRGFSADDSPEKAAALDFLFLHVQFLVRFCDNAGLIRLAGTPVESLELSYELDTDADVPGSRGYSLTLEGQLSQRPAYA